MSDDQIKELRGIERIGKQGGVVTTAYLSEALNLAEQLQNINDQLEAQNKVESAGFKQLQERVRELETKLCDQEERSRMGPDWCGHAKCSTDNCSEGR